MSVRPAVEADAARLAALHAETFPEPWSAEEIATLLGAPGGFGLACDDGFLLGRAIGGEAEILTVAVRPSARRRGHGAALVTTAAQLAAAAGSTALFLEVATDNEPALALYAALGFSRAGFRPRYYKRRGEPIDALVLRRELRPT